MRRSRQALAADDFPEQVAEAVGYVEGFPVDPAQACQLYRDGFRPSARSERPRVILALAAIVADDERRAAELGRAAELVAVRLRTGQPGPIPSPQEAAAHPWTERELELAKDVRRFTSVGTADQVRSELTAKATRAGADELIITTLVHDPAERRHSYACSPRRSPCPPETPTRSPPGATPTSSAIRSGHTSGALVGNSVSPQGT